MRISNISKLFVVMLATSLAACDDMPFDVEEHGDAHGVVVTNLDGSLIAEAQEAEPWVFAGGASHLEITASASREVRIWFVDGDGDRFQLDIGDDEHSLAVTVANPDVATFDSHGDHGDFFGVAAGTSTATISLMHGDHEDYTAAPLPIAVIAP